MRSLGGTLLTLSGLLACPCHLPLTLPLLLTLLGGTSLGLFLRANTGLIVVGAGAYFLAAIGAGFFLLTRSPRGDERALCCSLKQRGAAGVDCPGAGIDGARTTLNEG